MRYCTVRRMPNRIYDDLLPQGDRPAYRKPGRIDDASLPEAALRAFSGKLGRGKGSGLNEILNPAGDLFIIHIHY